MALVYTVLAMVTFGGLGITYKIADRLKCDKPQTNFFLYFSAAVIQLIYTMVSGKLVLKPTTLAIGAVAGVISLICVVALRKAIAKGRISTSWTIINLSMIVPVIASVFIWKEIPMPRDYAGIAFTVIAITLLGVDIGRSGE